MVISMLINEGYINPGTIDLLVKTLKQNKVIGLITMNCIETSLIEIIGYHLRGYSVANTMRIPTFHMSA